MNKKVEVYGRSGSVKLVIGDPMYIEHIEEGDKSFEKHILSKSHRGMDIQVSFSEIEEVPTATILLHPTGKPFLFEVDGDTISCSQKYKPKEGMLGCDTACYEINGVEINTMSDGQFGGYFEIIKERNLVLFLDGGWQAESYEDFKEKVLSALKLSEKDKKK